MRKLKPIEEIMASCTEELVETVVDTGFRGAYHQHITNKE